MLNESEQYKERSLTIVLLDLVNSTGFVEVAGAQRAARWFQYHDRLARSLLYRFSGREIDRSDGFLFTFDRVFDALNFSLYYQQTIPQKTRIKARIGIHYGCVVEVHQHELLVLVGAKPVEVEGLSKNIAARTMSLAQPDQVLMTKPAFERVKNRFDAMTPKGTRFACVGLYRYQGVKAVQVVYAVGSDIKTLQPPQSTAKVKRLGGPKRVKSRMRHKTFLEWAEFILLFLFWLALGYLVAHMWPYIKFKFWEWWNEQR